MSPAEGHVHVVAHEIVAALIGVCVCGAEWSRSGRGKARKRRWRDPKTAYAKELRREWIASLR